MFKKQVTIVLTLSVMTFAVASAYGDEGRNAETAAVLKALDGIRVAQAPAALALQPAAKDCCQPFTPKDCPAVKPCRLDACVTIQITPLDKQDAVYTYNGTNSFMNVFGAAVARGAENATIRAMNSIKVCANCTQTHEGECDPNKPAASAEAPAPAP